MSQRFSALPAEIVRLFDRKYHQKTPGRFLRDLGHAPPSPLEPRYFSYFLHFRRRT